MRYVRLLLACFAVHLLFALPTAGPASAQSCIGSGGVGCGVLGSCCSGLACVAGVCVAPPSCQDEGEVCLSSSQCCGSRVCNLGFCRTQRQAGETCGPAAPCEDPLVCDLSTDGFTLRCRHDPPIFGEACSAFVPCAGGLACTSLTTQRCVHSPARDGEFCDAAAPCGDGLFCEPFSQTCEPELAIGEVCNAFTDRCRDGLVCLNCFQVDVEGCRGASACLPNIEIDRQPFSEAQCLDIYSPEVHDDLIANPPANGSEVVTYGTGRQIVVGIGTTEEIGAAYGTQGQYGCYKTQCFAVEADAEASIFTVLSNFTEYSKVAGPSQVAVIEAGNVINFSIGRISDIDQDPIFGTTNGTAEAWTLGIGGSPLSVGAFLCDTELDTVIGNGPPVARCSDVELCADANLCDVPDASIDDGSSDPDGDPLDFDQTPPGPYSIGSHTATLEVTDVAGESDTCSATIDVLDCTAPSIVCPEDVVAECTANGTATVDPGDASATDCSASTLSDPGPGTYPLGSTPVDYVATDVFGNASGCTSTVSVVDTTPPSIDAVNATPDQLWPPNHEMRTVAVDVTAGDACDASVECEIVEVDSNEPDAGTDSEDLPGDIRIQSATTVALRAERAGSGSGRRYTITVECSDSTGGGSSRATAQVIVPHDASP